MALLLKGRLVVGLCCNLASPRRHNGFPRMPHGNVAGTASNSGAIFERVAFPVDYVACMVNARPRPEITNAPWPSGPSLIIIYF
jgi:hypothetical protein